MMMGVSAVVIAAACSSGPPPPPPGPDPDSLAEAQRIRDSIANAQRIADSIARSQQMEEDRIRTQREEASRRTAAVTAEVRDMMAARVHFDYDKSDVRAGQDTDMLMQKVAILNANRSMRIEIVGHCDERGSDEYNEALGQRRAIAARDFLVNRGVDASRISVASMGERQPADSRANEDAWAMNRRDEFRITAGGDQLVKPAGM